MAARRRDFSLSIDGGTDSVITPSGVIEQPPATKRQLSVGLDDDLAQDGRIKRPRLHPATPPTSRRPSAMSRGRSRWVPSSPQSVSDAPPAPLQAGNSLQDDFNTQHSSVDPLGSQGRSNTTTSCAARVFALLKNLLFPLLPSVPHRVTSSSMSTNVAGPSQAVQHFFANASNFTIEQFNSTVISSGDNQQVQLLVQLLQTDLAQRGLSQPVGYNRENGVTITDALGTKMVLPPSIMHEFSDVHDLMLKHFWGKIGEERVAEHKYSIMTEHDGTLVQPENWDHVLKSGEGLIMCMAVERVWAESVQNTCPQCGKTRLGTYYENDSWIKC